MPEAPLEEIIPEKEFATSLELQGEPFFRLGNTLLKLGSESWNKKHYHQLMQEANDLESFLDDYGARDNRSYAFLREIVASLRGFAGVGYSTSHLEGRFDSYGVWENMPLDTRSGLLASAKHVTSFTRDTICSLIEAAFEEVRANDVPISKRSFPEEHFGPVAVRVRLPRNVGEEEISDERQKIAEVASKFLQAWEMLDQLGLAKIMDGERRREYLASACTEEHARVYEATVHNLQSAYDTYIKNTVLESQDEHLPHLRGYSSVALHLLEAVTGLTHFYERHESDIRSKSSTARMSERVSSAEVQDVILNHLLHWAKVFMDLGCSVAERLVRDYTNVQELEVSLSDDLALHARPASLIVNIVNHYGTPVEMEIGKQRCNAASILELLVTVGSHPNSKRYLFRGDVNPLQDIGLLFEYGLGEDGLDGLPRKLDYLKRR